MASILRRTVPALVALAVVMAIAVTASARPPAIFDRSISVRYDGGTFSGRVDSSQRECRRGNGSVFRKRDGKDQRVDSTQIGRRGRYEIVAEVERGASYYARVAEIQIPGTGICPAKRSGSIEIP